MAAGTLVPEVVVAFAYLCMTDDDGLPIVPADHHRLWLEYLCNEDISDLLIVAPPDSAKTTWVIAYIACYIGFYPTRSTIFASVSDGVASKRSLALRTLVNSSKWRELFGDTVLPVSNAWNENSWAVAKDGEQAPGSLHRTVASYGTGGSIVGARADIVIADDILDFDNTRTENQRKFVTNWAHNSLFTRLKGGGKSRKIMIGTSWTPDDIMGQIRRDPLSRWTVVHMPSLSLESDGFYAYVAEPNPDTNGIRRWRIKIHNEKVIWPSRRGLEDVLDLRDTTPAPIWAVTYQGSLKADSLFAVLKREWYKKATHRFIWIQRQKPQARFISLDTASQDDPEDPWTAWSVGDLQLDYSLNVIEMGRKHVEMPELIDLIKSLKSKHDGDHLLKAIVIENKSSGIGAIQTLSRYLEYYRVIRPYNPRVDKPTRWAQAAVWCKVGMVRLPWPSPDVPWLHDAEEELFTAPSSEFLDQIDSFAQLVLYLEHYISQGYRARKANPVHGGYLE